MQKFIFSDQTEINSTEIENLELDIHQIDAHRFHVLDNGKSNQIEILSIDKESKSITWRINGKTATVQVKDRMDLLLEKMGLSDLNSNKVSDLKAPMPGLVLDILVVAGQSIQKGDKLLVLEAMKMENNLKAVGDGIVKKVAIQKGNTVDKGDLLIEFE